MRPEPFFSADGIDRVLRVREREAQGGVAVVEVARETGIHAEMLVIIFG